MSTQLQNEELGVLRGSTTPPASVSPIRAFSAGRVCEADACETVLSRYNDGARCWQHEPARHYQIRVRPKHPLHPAA
jgi:hypothetical protein